MHWTVYNANTIIASMVSGSVAPRKLITVKQFCRTPYLNLDIISTETHKTESDRPLIFSQKPRQAVYVEDLVIERIGQYAITTG